MRFVSPGRRARGHWPRVAALVLVFTGGPAATGHAARLVTHYWQADLGALDSPAVQRESPRAQRTSDRSLRTADSLYLLSLNAAPQRDERGRYTWQFDRADVTPETVMVVFRDRAATEFARQVSPLPRNALGAPSPQVLQAEKDWAARMNNRVHFLDGRQRKLEKRYQANIFQRFQYAAAMVIEAPRNMLSQLSRRSDVASIQPLGGGNVNAPSPCSAPGETPPVTAEVMGLERFRTAGYANGRIGLLDTGVRSDYSVFSGPGRIEAWHDCSDPLAGCVQTSGQQDADAEGHGTSSAAILIGQSAADPAGAGVTDALLTSYKVYRPMGSRYGLDRVGAGRAMEQAIHAGYDVIVAEIADPTDPAGSVLTRLASEAFDLGTIVVAAGGNDSLNPLPAPAVAARALGIGACCVHDAAPILAHSRGRTADGRVKPEVGAPTGVYTVGSASGQQVQRAFSGTSGATPFAGAAALFLRNWMRGTGAAASPGMVYAMMLACGADSRVDSRTGAGLMVLPSGGAAWWGRAIVGARQQIEIPLSPAAASPGVEAALWWPEYGRNGALPQRTERAVIALGLTAPGGRAGLSADPGSVFQRVSAPVASASPGPWTLRIMGTSLPRGAREVYWAAWAKPASPIIP